jgi:hypothetical protein
VINNNSATTNIAAVTLPTDTSNPLTPIELGIPLPRTVEWDPARRYACGEVALWRGQVYKALAPTTDRPDVAASWTKNSTDRRLKLMVSGYTHQAHGTSQLGRQVYPFVTWYDEFGKLIGRSFTDTADTRVADTFSGYSGTDALAPLGGRTTDYGGKTWTDAVPGWIRDSYDDGVVRPADGATRALSVVDYGSANATVAATIASLAGGTLKQGILLRYVDSANYVRATTTALESVTAGVVATIAAYSKSPAAGDRLSVTVNGSSYTVQVNGQTVATASSTKFNTSTKFGIVTE